MCWHVLFLVFRVKSQGFPPGFWCHLQKCADYLFKSLEESQVVSQGLPLWQECRGIYPGVSFAAPFFVPSPGTLSTKPSWHIFHPSSTPCGGQEIMTLESRLEPHQYLTKCTHLHDTSWKWTHLSKWHTYMCMYMYVMTDSAWCC